MVRSSPRQPGSALKPFTYALAFEEGRTPATVLADIPSSFPTADPGVLYSPRNYDGRYRGPLLARRALAGSENVPAVALASEVGVSTLVRFLTRAGFTTFDRNGSYYGLGITLGNAEVRLDQLVAAYAMFGRGGAWTPPTFVKSRLAPEAHAIVSPRTAFWITDILTDADARSFIFGRGGDLEFPFEVAVKTGTSQAYHDNWTVGYSRHVTVGVWVGNFDRSPLKDSTGVTGAGPIFHAVMLAAERRTGNPVQHRRDRRHADRRPSGCDLRALGHAREPVVPDAHDRVAAVGRRGSAVLVASPERRRPADDLSAGISRLGGKERRSIRDGSSDAPDGASNAAQRQLQPPH